uniref:Uncharacterized protein n=1 Tax=Arundo donax TaxID=35708 RepID=A0A0A9DUK9_ARUDO
MIPLVMCSIGRLSLSSLILNRWSQNSTSCLRSTAASALGPLTPIKKCPPYRM